MPLRFRWASLQLEVLCSLKLDADVRAMLGQLPPKLEQLYLEIYEKRILSYQGEAGRSILSNALKWLLCAQRPMRSSEFCTAIAMNLNISPGDLTKERVLDLSHNFVVFDDGLDTFRFAHLSVREFLEKQPEYSLDLCHILAAEVCLFQLIGSSKCSAPESFLRNEYAIETEGKLASTAETISDGLHKYATVIWMKHCQMAGENARIRNARFVKVFRFFLFDSYGIGSTQSTWNLSYSRRKLETGCSSFTRCKLQENTKSSVKCYFLASAFGFCEILRTYLGREGLSRREKQESLVLAAWNGQDEAFKLLLSSEEDLETDGVTAKVVEYLTRETVEWFLDRKGKIELTNELAATAAGRGHLVTKMVLERCEISNVTKKNSSDCRKNWRSRCV